MFIGDGFGAIAIIAWTAFERVISSSGGLAGSLIGRSWIGERMVPSDSLPDG